MRIGLVNLGDELLLGKTLNTNAFDLAEKLIELGQDLVFTLAIGDRIDLITGALRECVGPGLGALPRCDLLILTGGLGPTQDDLTREAVADFLSVPLVFNPEAAAWLAERLGVTRDAIPAGQLPQVEVPRGAVPLRNPAGTACGFRFETSGTRVFALPGVPAEFHAMFELHCRPELLRRDAVLLRRKLVTFGLLESRQRELLRDFAPPLPFHFSSLPAESGVTLALEALVPHSESASHAARLEAAWKELLSRLPEENIVDRNGGSLPEAVFRLLRARHATVATAESCTAGALGFLLTETPGSSEVFQQGVLTYANEAKTQWLGVSAKTLAEHGAVSEPVALAMAHGCREATRTDYAVSITGIAGPGGGSLEKPVGLVYIGVASARGGKVYRFQFRSGDRKSIRWRSAYTALNQLRLFIINDL